MPRHTDTVTVELTMAAHQLRHLDAVAASVGLGRAEALHTALAHWLDEAVRTTAQRNRLLTMRARVVEDVGSRGRVPGAACAGPVSGRVSLGKPPDVDPRRHPRVVCRVDRTTLDDPARSQVIPRRPGDHHVWSASAESAQPLGVEAWSGPVRARVRPRQPAPSPRVPRSRAGCYLWPGRESWRTDGRCLPWARSEAVLGCAILNRMTALGRPVSYRIGM